MNGKVSLLLFLLSGLLSKNEANNYCGESIYSSINGTIKTNPTPSNDNISCRWTVRAPYNGITTIRILQCGLDKCLPKYPCCLTVAEADSSKTYMKLCNKALKKPIVLSVRGNKTLLLLEASQNVDTWIVFSTRGNGECHNSEFQCYDKTGCYNSTDNCKGDFICKDHSDKVDCHKCQINHTPCDHKSKRCFDPIDQRCDGVIHCPKGEDELGCSELCPDLIKCPKDKKCVTPHQICDTEIDCSDSSDEKNCLNGNTSNIYIAIVFVISSLCSMCFLCLVFQWISTRRSTRRFLNNPPEFPLAPFEGPGEHDQESSSSEFFTDSEFRQGGGIYESYLQAIKKSKSIKCVQSGTAGQRSYMDLDGDNELIVLASLNVPVEMCVGLTLSSETTNLAEMVAQQRMKNLSKASVVISQQASAESAQSTEIRCIEENPQELNRGSGQIFGGSHSSEWTDIEEVSEGSSRIIYVKSAQKCQKSTV